MTIFNVERIRDIVLTHWDRASVVEHEEYVEIHFLDLDFGVRNAKREQTIEDLEELGFTIQRHRDDNKINLWTDAAEEEETITGYVEDFSEVPPDHVDGFTRDSE